MTRWVTWVLMRIILKTDLTRKPYPVSMKGELSLVVDLYHGQNQRSQTGQASSSTYRYSGTMANCRLLPVPSSLPYTGYSHHAKGIDLELSNAKTHYSQKGTMPFLRHTFTGNQQNKRVVNSNAHFTALCPFASRFPYEVWIVPRFHDEAF